MPKGRGGSGGGGATGREDLHARFEKLERLVHSLGGGGSSGGGGVGTGVGSGPQSRGGGSGGERATSRGRPGDWRCGACGAFPCFARTTVCFKCRAAREDGGGTRGARQGSDRGSRGIARPTAPSAYLGPVGAGGTRPLLGRSGAGAAAGGNGQPASRRGASADRAPTARVPGASLAAMAEADRSRAQSGEPHHRQHQLPRDGRDADGFQEARNAVRFKGNDVGPATNVAPALVPNRRNAWADLAEMDDDDADEMDRDISDQATGDQACSGDTTGDGDGCSGDDIGDDHDGDEDEAEEGHEQKGEDELRREWQALVQACRAMERDASSFPAALLADARARRDAAEQSWRAAKQPHPLHKRLRWAEAAVREAEEKEAGHRRELREHLEAAARRTRELEGRVAVGAARTARKRVALDALRLESAPRALPAAEKAARIAATGIALDVAPPLAALIERMATPQGGDLEELRQDLQLVAVSLSRVEGVLREGAGVDTPPPERPAHYDISDGGSGGGGNGGDGSRPGAAVGGGDGAADHEHQSGVQATRWSKLAENGPWRRRETITSAEAVEEARRVAQRRSVGQTAGNKASDQGADGRQDSVAGSSADGLHVEAAAMPGAHGATTNDLAEAERREHAAAQRQMLASLRHAQAQQSEQQRAQDELERQKRQRLQQEEMQRHQAAFQRAAEERAAEEMRQREVLIASMSPQELAKAAELHARQAAVGTHAFGTVDASQQAGLVHQDNARRSAEAAAAAGEAVELQRLLDMSPEELAAWDREHDLYA